MRPSYHIPGIGSLREITIWKAIVFGILTLGIYLLVVTYGHSREVNEARENRFDLWVVFFILGIFFGPLMIVVWVMNLIGVGEIRRRAGLDESAMGIVALILAILLPPIGYILWAIHFNDTLRAASAA